MSLPFREVFARYWADYDALYGDRIPETHRRAAEAILACGTAELGGSLYRCEDCGLFHFAYHSCNHRNCPQCGHQAGLDWAEKQKNRLIPDIPYHFITFTVPESLRRVFRSNQELCYKLLFQCSAQALQEVAAIDRHLGGSLGFLGILHTWTRQLEYHPHIHYIVPQAGLTPDGGWVRAKDPEFFLPVRHLSVKMRILMQRALQAADPALYASIPKAVWRENWYTYSKPVGSGEHVIEYLSRYVTRTALGKNAIIADDGKYVTISYIDSKTGEKKSLRLTGIEFIRRFLQHVLPKGFRRIRTYGWLSPAAHKRFNRIQAILDWTPQKVDQEKRPILCKQCEGVLEWLFHWHPGRGPPAELGCAIPLAS